MPPGERSKDSVVPSTISSSPPTGTPWAIRLASTPTARRAQRSSVAVASPYRWVGLEITSTIDSSRRRCSDDRAQCHPGPIPDKRRQVAHQHKVATGKLPGLLDSMGQLGSLPRRSGHFPRRGVTANIAHLYSVKVRQSAQWPISGVARVSAARHIPPLRSLQQN